MKIVLAAAATTALFVLLAFSFGDFCERKAECDSRDGVMLKGASGWVCVSRDALK